MTNRKVYKRREARGKEAGRQGGREAGRQGSKRPEARGQRSVVAGG